MIVKVNRGEFLRKLRIVEKAITENKIKPIISCVYLEVKGNDTLFFCGTNLELTITSTMKCDVEEGGKLVFVPQLIDEYIKELSDDVILLKTSDSTLTIETTDSSSEFSLMNAEEFPMLPSSNGNEKESLSMTGKELLDIFEKVKFSAAGTSENLPLNCLRFDIQNKVARFVSTDTYRLTYLVKEIEEDIQMEISIPLNTIEAITKLLKSENLYQFDISVIDNQVYFISDEIEIVSRTIELPFPNYGGILGTSQYDKQLVVNTEDFIKVLKRIQIFVRGNLESKYGAIFEFSGNKVLVKGVSSVAKIREELDVDYKGDDLKISLNVKFLLDFLQNFDKDAKILIELKASNSSVRITRIDNENYIYVVMPLALKDF